MKKIIFTLFLLMLTNTFYSQNTGNEMIKNDKSEFLNFDLTKNLVDYGFSRTSLKKDLTPIELEYLKRYNNHFLSDFSFDKEVAAFRNSGFIAFIFLEKKFNENSNLTNENKAKEFYSKILSQINSKYGVYTNTNDSFTEWITPKYQLTLNIQSDNSVIIAYNNLLLRDLEKPDSNFSRDYSKTSPSNFSDQKEREQRTKRLEAFLNNFLKAYEQLDIRSFARLNGEVMEIYFERKKDMTLSYEDRDLQREIKKLELDSFQDLMEHVISKTCGTQEDLETLNRTTLEKIKFTQDIFYKDGTESILTRTVDIDDLLKLKTPFRKKEILDILN